MELDFLEELLEETPQESIETPLGYNYPKYPVPKQVGPLRQFDTGMRCAKRGCSSPTYFKLKGIPTCMIHAMRDMNEMLYELGVEK